MTQTTAFLCAEMNVKKQFLNSNNVQLDHIKITCKGQLVLGVCFLCVVWPISLDDSFQLLKSVEHPNENACSPGPLRFATQARRLLGCRVWSVSNIAGAVAVAVAMCVMVG